MPRLPTGDRPFGRWKTIALALAIVALLALWCTTSPRAQAILGRIAYAFLLALPPVLLIGGVLLIAAYLRPRDPGSPSSKRPPTRKR